MRSLFFLHHHKQISYHQLSYLTHSLFPESNRCPHAPSHHPATWKTLSYLLASCNKEIIKLTVHPSHALFLAEVVEHACSITSLMLGETLPSITKDMDTYTYRLPLGVCAGIAPFNFPAMIPLWMFPMGMVCGNTYLLKPSERVPTCAMLLAKMLQDAGAPDGTLNIIHGQHDGERWRVLC